MRRISISELNLWGKCRLAWNYRYVENLVLPETSAMLASGKAVHGVVEATLKHEISRAQWPAKAEALLQEFFAGEEDVQKQTQRYLPGVLRAVERLPREMLEGDWQVEQPIEAEVGGYRIWGIPDFYRVKDDEVEIVEVKSTSGEQTPLDYLLWNPQHRQYAVLLDRMYPGRAVFVTYVVLQTGKKAGPALVRPWLMTPRVLAETADLMARTARELATPLAVVPTYSRACAWCDFSQLCTASITGGNPEPLKKELFTKREPRE